ncbi:hypothetical protein CK203_072578 [Vitis vinifera]|uniref:Uncharacterized protein n=1 Tax=Vitis vinifera TaxID=29760 RepID=A0A438F949_VITVI|nr:hypothetical protein CK203_072578 [Vitis vinifera]
MLHLQEPQICQHFQSHHRISSHHRHSRHNKLRYLIEIIPLAPTTPSIVPMPEAISSASPTILEAPLIVPATSTPPPSESSITISTLEFRGPCHTLQTLSTTQEPTAPSEEATPAEQAIPSEKATPVKHTMPHQETTTAEVETPIQSTQETTTEPSSPHDPPTTT